jgi:hypothetical protein
MKPSMIRKFYLCTSTAFILSISLFFVPKSTSGNQQTAAAFPKGFVIPSEPVATTPNVYDSLKLGELGLSRDAFNKAVKGQELLAEQGKLSNENVISIVDFSLPSSKKRLFVLDLKSYKLLFNSLVAHGKNSGEEWAYNFSNSNESNKSSLGFYVTRDTYNGKHGYSLKLDGVEKGINDNALNRGIVMHSAWYVNDNIVRERGYIGRSEGCPAIPQNVYKPIISTIKGGTCLFLYHPDNTYASRSQILKQVS